jgi:hypothetical protein
MTRWQPDIDLCRLLEALSADILAASDEEVRQQLARGGSPLAISTRAIREVIAEAMEDGDGPGLRLTEAAAARPTRLPSKMYLM